MSRSKSKRRREREGPHRRRGARVVALFAGALALMVTALLLGRFVLSSRDARPWNLLLVSIDTLRADELSAYGGSVSTPAIDRLAREGVLFESVQTVAPLTLPAHASLFTAQWPYTHGVRDNVGFYLPDGTPTLASHLQAHGYRTGGFVGAFVLDSRFGIGQGFEYYFDEFDALTDDVDTGFVSQRPGADVVARARDWIESMSGGPEAPFFAFVHLFEPHTPYEPPPPFAHGAAADADVLYRGEVEYADALVGELLSWLDAKGLLDRTLVVLTSDHGESLGEHGETTHGFFVYESTLRIPLLMQYPGAPEGARIPGLVRLIDVAPTVLELLGLPGLVGAEGVSLVSRIENPETPEERVGYAETFLTRLHYGWSELRSVRRGRYKLILAPEPELYDLEADPSESTNLFHEDAPTATRLMRELSAMLKTDAGPEPKELDRESRSRLQSLGYLGSAGSEPPGADPQRADPKQRLDIYHALNDPALASVEPSDRAAFGAALSLLARAVREEPPIAHAHILYGDLLIKVGRFGEAARVFGELVAFDASFESFFGLGLARQGSGELAAAEEAYLRAHEIEPRNTKSHYRLSELAASRGDVAAAERWLVDAMALRSDRVLAAKLATLLASTGRKLEARAILDDIGADPVVLYELGQSLLENGAAAEALETLRAAAELSPEDPDIHHGIGNALLATGNPEAALEAYGQALSLEPCFAGAHANRGAAYLQIGREADAMASLQQAVTCDPSHIVGYRNLAAVKLQSGDLEGAIETLGRARQRAPGDPEIERDLEQLTAYRDRQK